MAENTEATILKSEIRDTNFGKSIFINGQLMTVTTEADGELDQMDIDVLSSLHAQSIEQAILSYRAGRSDNARIGGLLEALAWTVGFAAVAFVIMKLRNRLPDRIATAVEKRILNVQEATNDMVRGTAVASLVRYVLRLIILLLLIILLYYYLSFVLFSFA